jgi:hypothetical protein
MTSLAHAAAAFMATPEPRETDAGVEHIDVGDEWPEDR